MNQARIAERKKMRRRSFNRRSSKTKTSECQFKYSLPSNVHRHSVIVSGPRTFLAFNHRPDSCIFPIFLVHDDL